MTSRGSKIYDQDDFFERYMQRRNWNENANDTIERPIIYEMIDEIRGDNILDLGCGMGGFGYELLNQDALFYTGVEGSANMVKKAKDTLKNKNFEIIHTPIEDWNFPESKYDLIVSRLVIQYIEDIQWLFKMVYHSLKVNGRFVFSIEHPVMTSSFGLIRTEGEKTNWIVDNYFYSGEREQDWLGNKVKKYHRTIEEYFVALQQAGFQIEQLRESKPEENNFINQETYQRRMRIPLFLFMKGRKMK